MALSHEILWRERERKLADSIRLRLHQSGKLESSPPFLGKLFKSLSFALPFINPSGWLALARRPLVGISSLFAPFFGVGRTTA